MFFLLISSPNWGQISGFVFDENKSFLPGANILLLPDSLWAHSDKEGWFTFVEFAR